MCYFTKNVMKFLAGAAVEDVPHIGRRNSVRFSANPKYFPSFYS